MSITITDYGYSFSEPDEINPNEDIHISISNNDELETFGDDTYTNVRVTNKDIKKDTIEDGAEIMRWNF